jgi:hypothetical protein
LTQIDILGRKVQDKKNIQTEMDSLAKMAANLTREKITVAMVKEKADKTIPSNDRIMRLGDERLELRQRLCNISRKKYWTHEFLLDGERQNFKAIWLSAVRSFPRLRDFHFIHDNGAIVRTKTDTIKFIGNYLALAKKSTKLICDFCHGNVSSHKRFVPKRDRNFEQVDLLECMGFVRVVDISDSSTEIAESVALTCLSSFQKIDEHYTYTCVDSDVPTSPQTTGEDGDEEVINTN